MGMQGGALPVWYLGLAEMWCFVWAGAAITCLLGEKEAEPVAAAIMTGAIVSTLAIGACALLEIDNWFRAFQYGLGGLLVGGASGFAMSWLAVSGLTHRPIGAPAKSATEAPDPRAAQPASTPEA